MSKKIVGLLLALVLVVAAFAACAQTAAPAESPSDEPEVSESVAAEEPSEDADVGAGKTVGVSMPTKSLQRWNQDGSNMKKQLEAKGYIVDLQYAGDNELDKQVEQIENMITKEVDVLVVASVDGSALGTVLADAKAAEIPVIAYDRLIRDTDAVDYYATFDNYKIGAIQGQYIVDTLGLAGGEKGPFTLEVFGGSPDDNNAYFFNNGAMDTLKPYIDEGVLIIKSEQVDMDVIAIPKWDAKTAQARMDNLLTAYYTDENIDVVLSPNDSLAQGISAALKSSGYGTGDKPYPILTGQDCDIINTNMLIDGEQSMSIFKDTRQLAEKVVEMVTAILDGAEVPVNDKESYDNGVKVVPSFLLEPQYADLKNYKELLIESGYYLETEDGHVQLAE